MFGVSPIVIFAVMVGFIYGRFISSSPQMHRLRLHKVRMLESKLMKMRMRKSIGTCDRCMTQHTQRSTKRPQDPGLSPKEFREFIEMCVRNPLALPEEYFKPKATPTLESVRQLLEGDEDVPVASTGCELTDQIFEAARKKGIMPVDFLGPALDYDAPAEEASAKVR